VTLPDTIDPQTVSVAGAVVRHAIEQSHLAAMPDDEKQWMIECWVSRIIDAGGFAKDGALLFPRSATT
jgi:hypothetical protein